MENKIPLINEHNEVVGETTIPEAVECGYMRRVVRIFITAEDGSILLQKRPDTMPTFPGLWDMAAAGHIDLGEEAAAAACREMQEEIGLSVDLELVASAVRSELPNDRSFSYLYKAVVPADTKISYDAHEVAGIQWVSEEELSDWIAASPEQFVPLFLSLWELFHDKLVAS